MFRKTMFNTLCSSSDRTETETKQSDTVLGSKYKSIQIDFVPDTASPHHHITKPVGFNIDDGFVIFYDFHDGHCGIHQQMISHTLSMLEDHKKKAVALPIHRAINHSRC